MMFDIGIDYKDRLYLSIGINKAIFVLTFESHDFVLYDEFKVNVEETVKKEGDADYSREELAGDAFKQPHYAFTITDNVSILTINKNIDDISISIHHDGSHDTFASYIIEDKVAENIYDNIIAFINHCDHIKTTKIERVILEQPGKWVIYNCKKRYIHNDLDSWNKFGDY